jgi:hypothetical protein
MSPTPRVEEAVTALGAQFGNVWFQDRVQGWVVGVAPGALSLEDARGAIVRRLQQRFPSGQGAELIDRLHVSAQPYQYAQLRHLQDEIFGRFQAAGWKVGYSVGVACTLSDAFRVEVWLYNDSTPEIQARARGIAAVQQPVVGHEDVRDTLVLARRGTGAGWSYGRSSRRNQTIGT